MERTILCALLQSCGLLLVLCHCSLAGSSCPAQCVCETRPWYTPQSVYHQARTVDCNELHLSRVPPNISGDTQVLLLQSNNISHVTVELQSLVNLTELDLSQNHFTQIRDIGLNNFTQLITLYLEENQVKELPDFCLKDLANLEELYINHNQISSIGPKAFSGLSNLLRLHLNSNKLVAIDSHWFESLPNLEILMIGENPILGLQDMNFHPLSKLHSLVLAGMGLKEVPPGAFQGLDYLESLSFFDNRLMSVPKDALRELPNLKFLDLNKNPISRVQEGDFQDFLHLEELSLNNMDELVAVERGAFANLPEMAKLEIRSNPHLSYIDRAAFMDVSALRTLLVSNNDLSLLPRELFASFPRLDELSLHSNPLRCDCLSTWWPVLGNQSTLRLLESQTTLCAFPPHLAGRPLQEVVATSWNFASNTCLPLISLHTFPPHLNVSAGEPLTLHCWAGADPAPQFYWVTPTGDKVTSEVVSPALNDSGGAKKKHRLQDQGALEIRHVGAEDAGLYTCVAWNADGADTRSVTVYVDRSDWRGGGGGRGAGDGSGNSTGALVVLAKIIHSQSVVLEWKVFPSASSAHEVGQPKWASAVMKIDNPQISYTANVPADVQEYNLTHLLPSTEYQVCLTMSASEQPVQRSCINVTTKEASFAVEMVAQPTNVALAAVMGSLFAICIMALLVFYMGRRVKQKSCHHSLKKYMQHATSIPLNDLYPPLINLWESEAEKEKEGPVDPQNSQIDTSKTYMW
ncbi:leucine-rich repeat neuronal protein 1 isoform X2 [Anguilla anguilla]|nr:leucine-rich repeat neuronal protein 1 isoform X2 [Anguilla anguilla]XP_035236405.1 leucine-rich repeat neuronal protein 1 isoform X2 [Anguilla anguilla]XP_035236406.1 leucine-rich repeat neuronal protein 1 isoform X2 [Anguilla anguilla]XP_035236407.1 leucine-rich repeat neuronal protein 1 isoform X2 [Anguilla anguilla]XP_035236408.1 leucine-rich repeat neuronal protein 1 isoform X2 [Anguilla anguilla]XP_035236409.1 leucine-rich repeat neuronal protein 1 isoform X2 [Anguilla anguilla]XP_03